MQGGALIGAVWLNFPGLFSSCQWCQVQVVANRFYTYSTDYQSLEKDACEFVVRGAWQVCSCTVETSSSKVGRSLDGGSVEYVLILNLRALFENLFSFLSFLRFSVFPQAWEGGVMAPDNCYVNHAVT